MIPKDTDLMTMLEKEDMKDKTETVMTINIVEGTHRGVLELTSMAGLWLVVVELTMNMIVEKTRILRRDHLPDLHPGDLQIGNK